MKVRLCCSSQKEENEINNNLVLVSTCDEDSHKSETRDQPRKLPTCRFSFFFPTKQFKARFLLQCICKACRVLDTYNTNDGLPQTTVCSSLLQCDRMTAVKWTDCATSNYHMFLELRNVKKSTLCETASKFNPCLKLEVLFTVQPPLAQTQLGL